ncbi:hypothetical protein D3C81_1844610 [compost metagenome]
MPTVYAKLSAAVKLSGPAIRCEPAKHMRLHFRLQFFQQEDELGLLVAEAGGDNWVRQLLA